MNEIDLNKFGYVFCRIKNRMYDDNTQKWIVYKYISKSNKYKSISSHSHFHGKVIPSCSITAFSDFTHFLYDTLEELISAHFIEML